MAALHKRIEVARLGKERIEAGAEHAEAQAVDTVQHPEATSTNPHGLKKDRQAKAKTGAKTKRTTFQAELETAVAEVRQLEQATSDSAAHEAEVWMDSGQAVAEENPCSAGDDALGWTPVEAADFWTSWLQPEEQAVQGSPAATTLAEGEPPPAEHDALGWTSVEGADFWASWPQQEQQASQGSPAAPTLAEGEPPPAEGTVEAWFDAGALAFGEGNHAEAAQWYRKAGEQGHVGAQKYLGLLCGLGRGVPKSFVQAYLWFALAAAQGDEKATQGRDLAASYMSYAKVAKAQKLVRDWRPKTS
ncbi:MAG: hypothetical protein C0405_00820 [Desulfovibrio sp.]|nr:hypothetical protein [Desulfovibrio sp.]